MPTYLDQPRSVRGRFRTRCRVTGTGYRAFVDEAYTIFWPQNRWRCALGVRRPLEVMFGGPHLSEPSFLRAGVSAGDLLYPIGVNQKVLFVFGRMRVREIARVDYESLPGCLERFPSWRFLAPTCTNEVIYGQDGTGVHGNRPVPGTMLKTLTYLPRRGPRPVTHVDDDGLLTSAISVQGIYRLAPASAADLDAVLAGTATVSPAPGGPGTETLF